MIVRLIAVILALFMTDVARAQAPWPQRFVKMVVPGGSGTAADVAARIVSQPLSELWGQQVIVENRAGAGGIVGTVSVVQSPPDGYSLLFAQGAPLSLTPNAFKSVPYDVERDLEPIIFIGYSPLVLASSGKLPVKTVAELIAMAKASPGKLSFATASSRSIPHLAGEYFVHAAGLQIVNVPYNGYPRALADLIAGTVHVIFGGSQIIPQRENGNLRILGVTSAKRIPDYPDIPAIAETMPGYDIAGWVAVMAPKGTPAALIAKVNADMRQVLDRPDVKKRLHGIATYPDTANIGTPEALAKYIRDDSALMQRIIKAANLQPVDTPSK